jgi:hypothetical protein
VALPLRHAAAGPAFKQGKPWSFLSVAYAIGFTGAACADFAGTDMGACRTHAIEASFRGRGEALLMVP